MRKATIIHLVPHPQPGRKRQAIDIYKLSNAAWNFAHTILWPEQTFCKEDLNRIMESIQSYFELAKDKKRAFTCFCERIVLTDRYISACSNRYVPNPSVWFNRNYEFGFAGTKNWYQRVQLRREEIPGYLQHISVIASYYLDYSLNPSATIFNGCRKKLLELKAHDLLQYFYNTIIHLTYSKQ
jgi:hypothetical protein